METSSRPRYLLVVDHIKGQIRSGQYRLGEILPGEDEPRIHQRPDRPVDSVIPDGECLRLLRGKIRLKKEFVRFSVPVEFDRLAQEPH
jgi:hypothetical protein